MKDINNNIENKNDSNTEDSKTCDLSETTNQCLYPKPPASAFKIFVNKRSKELATVFKTFCELQKILFREWKAMSEEEKETYYNQEEDDIYRFNEELQEFERLSAQSH